MGMGCYSVSTCIFWPFCSEIALFVTDFDFDFDFSAAFLF